LPSGNLFLTLTDSSKVGHPRHSLALAQSVHDTKSLATDFSQFGNVNLGDFNWLPQSDFQFDPQLFGDYREPQENILPKGTLDDGFFNDAFDIDFTTPYNMPITSAPAKKMNLIAQIDAAKNEDDMEGGNQMLTCNKIWYVAAPLITLASPSSAYKPNRENLQKCPKVQNGDFDLDGLCSELQKKAKCSGSGPVVDQEEFKTVMKKYLGKTDDSWDDCDILNPKSNAATPTKQE
jgi:AP-1-like factor